MIITSGFFFSVEVLFYHNVFSMSAQSHCPLQFRSAQYAFFCVPPLSHLHHRVLTCTSSENTPRCFLLFICFFNFFNHSPGLWKIKATYSNNPWLSCSTEFEVKGYGKHQYQTSHSHPPPQTDDFHFHTLQCSPACPYN